MQSWKKSKIAFLCSFLPPIMWIFIFLMIPMVILWLYSFSDKIGIDSLQLTWTLNNYKRAISPIYLNVFLYSIFLSILTTFIAFILGLPVALFAAFSSKKYRPWILFCIILPFWTNILIRVYAIMATFRTEGYLNKIISKLVLFFNFFMPHSLSLSYHPSSFLYTNFSLVFGLVYVGFPFMVLPIYSSLSRVDISFVEASLDLGISSFKTLFLIVLPMSFSGIVSGFFLTFIPTLGSYLIPQLMGGPRHRMIANLTTEQFKQANDWAFGAALSFLVIYVLFFIIAAFYAARFTFRSRSEFLGKLK